MVSSFSSGGGSKAATKEKEAYKDGPGPGVLTFCKKYNRSIRLKKQSSIQVQSEAFGVSGSGDSLATLAREVVDSVAMLLMTAATPTTVIT